MGGSLTPFPQVPLCCAQDQLYFTLFIQLQNSSIFSTLPWNNKNPSSCQETRVETGNIQTNSKLENVASGVNFELMMSMREIYVYPMGELTIVRRLRVGAVNKGFRPVVFRGRKCWGFCWVIKGWGWSLEWRNTLICTRGCISEESLMKWWVEFY